MGYRQTLEKAVDIAFKAAGDLVVDVTFTNKLSVYNENTQDVDVTVTNTVIPCIVTYKKKSSESGKSTVQAQIVAKSRDMQSIDIGDTITIAGTVWKLNGEANDNQYTVELTAEV